MENHFPLAMIVGILVKVLNATCIEGTTTTDNAMNLITLVKKQFRKVAAIL